MSAIRVSSSHTKGIFAKSNKTIRFIIVGRLDKKLSEFKIERILSMCFVSRHPIPRLNFSQIHITTRLLHGNFARLDNEVSASCPQGFCYRTKVVMGVGADQLIKPLYHTP
eukprot:scaffold2192_cov170-Amphora_coffeaeformis.AAC.2